jgi:D-arabinose 1-dehydrogenase-like Zn-dependent alcohol dehydrogenase
LRAPSAWRPRVVTSTGGSGGYAQRCAVPAAGLIPVLGPLPTDEALALLADGRTALALTDAAGPRPGETVLVEAAAGGVGSLLVQLAKRAGARVVALAGGPRKLAVARELGADLAVDYREPGWAEVVRREAGPADVVYDGARRRCRRQRRRTPAVPGLARRENERDKSGAGGRHGWLSRCRRSRWIPGGRGAWGQEGR